MRPSYEALSKRSQPDDTKPRRLCDGVGATGGVELVKHRANMEFGSVHRDAECACDHLVRGTFRHQLQHLALARRERRLGIRRRRRLRRRERHIRSLARWYKPQAADRADEIDEAVAELRVVDLERDHDRVRRLGQWRGLSPMVMVACVGAPARLSESTALLPTLSGPSARRSADTLSIGRPSHAAITSPCATPAAAPGPSRSTFITIAPTPPSSSRTGCSP